MEIILFIQSFKTPFLDTLFQIITMAGEQHFFIVIASFMIWCYDKESGWRVGFIFLTGVALNGALKDIFRIQRPIGNQNIISLRTHTAGGYSFPSGHTQNAALCWFSLMKIFRNKYIYIAGTVIVILTGISRLYLGVHWPSDVIGGVLIGAFWVLAADYAWKRFSIPDNITAIIITLSVMTLLCIVFADKYITRTTAALAGLLIGLYFEKKYINYTPSRKLVPCIFKMTSGILVIAGIMLSAKLIAPEGIISRSITFSLTGLWVTLGAPYTFIKAGELRNRLWS